MFTGSCPQPFSPYTPSSFVISSSSSVSNATHRSRIYFHRLDHSTEFYLLLSNSYLASSSGYQMGILHWTRPADNYWFPSSFLPISPLTDPTISQTYESSWLCFAFVSSPPKYIPNPTTANLLHSSTLVWTTGISPQDQFNSLWIIALSTKYSSSFKPSPSHYTWGEIQPLLKSARPPKPGPYFPPPSAHLQHNCHSDITSVTQRIWFVLIARAHCQFFLKFARFILQILVRCSLLIIKIPTPVVTPEETFITL